MFVVHGVWAHDALWLWAEDPSLPARAPARGGRPSRAPRAHPFAAGAAELAGALARLPGRAGGLAAKAAGDELTLRLPTAGDGPHPSPGLGREPPAGKSVLMAWRVPALSFEPPAAGRLLAVLAAPGEPYPGLAGAAGEDGYAARWRPVLDAADTRRARELAAAMPPLCRAADGAPAGTALASMLDALADPAARARLRAPLLPARRGRPPARLSMAERTVAALAGPDARVEVATPREAAEARALAGALGGWLADARLPSGPVRVCFRLVDPQAPAAGEPWRVEFALQSAEDPSLIVPAADVWAGAGLRWLAGDAHPDELLLAGLGRAARLFPELEKALLEAAPAMVALDTAGALRFLREAAPLLAGAGFGVLLPDWARKARLGLKLTTRSGSPASSPS